MKASEAYKMVRNKSQLKSEVRERIVRSANRFARLPDE